MSGSEHRGNVRWTGTGWKARIRSAGKRHSKTFPTEGEAWSFIDAMLALESDDAPPSLLTVGAEWLDSRERAGVVRHTRKERNAWARHVAQGWREGHRPLRSLKRKHLVAWVDSMTTREALQGVRGGEARATGRPLSRQTIKNTLRLVRGALEYACDRGLIDANPAAGVRVPRAAITPERKWTWLTLAEIEAVTALDHGNQSRPKQYATLTAERRALLAAAIYTGLRKSELFHLRWERVQLGDDPRLEVRAPLKSVRARRDVPLFPPAADALRAWRSHGGVTRSHGLAFPRRDGGIHGDSYDAGWSDHREGGASRPGAKTRAGIERRVRFHDLRHTFCSHLLQGSWGKVWTLEEVQELAGHSSISVTQKYAHLCPGGALEKARQMGRDWAPKKPRTHGASTPGPQASNPLKTDGN